MAKIQRKMYHAEMDEGRKRVIGIMAAILTSLHMQTADDLFGGPQGSPRTEKLIAASIQWAEVIMAKIDEQFSAGGQRHDTALRDRREITNGEKQNLPNDKDSSRIT
jgi:hypothetical protein